MRAARVAFGFPSAGSRPSLWAAAAALAGLLVSFFAPDELLPLLLAASAAGALLLAFLHPVPFCAAWLITAGSTPEMWLAELVGNEAMIVALVKFGGLLLALLCALRYGPRFDAFNPGFGFLLMFAISLLHGFHADLSLAESLRSVAGSAAPYAFAFSRLPRRWCGAIIRTTIWLPLLIVLAGAVFELAGLRPLFMALDGYRLAALGHPAFLGGFALTGVYAALLELFRAGRGRDLCLLVINAAILLLTGARAPVLMAACVGLVAFLSLPSARFPLARRLPVLLAAGMALPLVIALAGALTSIRLFSVLSEGADSLSGREVIWPLFQETWDVSPWFGWGVGAAKMLVDPDSLVAHLLGTTTAHNEYLRVGVDGGWVGIGVLLALFAAWAVAHTRRMRRTDRIMLRLVFVAFAIHSFTDSTLIATTASVLFAWVTATFARADREGEDAAFKVLGNTA